MVLPTKGTVILRPVFVGPVFLRQKKTGGSMHTSNGLFLSVKVSEAKRRTGGARQKKCGGSRIRTLDHGIKMLPL